jgi:ABC-type Fe3+-hydroxamate transport system substrate-binding protein
VTARIVSLVPSLTELVWWFGLGDALVGRTRFCTEPAGLIERVPIVGGTKNPKVEKIIGIGPELVIANREENRREDVEALREAGVEVLVTDPNSVAEALAMVMGLGTLLGTEAKARELIAEVEGAMAEALPERRLRVFVAVWKEPLLGLGAESYGNDLLRVAGAENVLGGRPRYPELTREELIDLDPELILLPDEPYPFKAADAKEFGSIARARVIDGKLLWWYGPRMADGIRALRTIFSAPEAR